jgi:type IV secretory pathway VirB10-like protein/polyhydroxyalkanoate synthesis regulator phasin
MALDFSKINIFNRLSARARVLFLFASVVGVVLLVYLGTRFLSNESNTTGPSRVANAPSGLQSIPGGQLTPEYSRALQQANMQAAQQAQMSGGSAVPTLLNIGQPGATQSANTQCNIICSDELLNVRSTLEDWVKQGKLDPDVASQLQQLADKNVSVSDYAATLDQLVKQGKLTPEQARELLERYKKQHANNLLKDSASTMDSLIKSGQLPLDVANQLLAAQKNNMSSSDYAAMLDKLVKEGKISPAVAQQLLAQYSQQHAREVVNQSIAILQQMTRAGELTADVAKNLIDLENRMVPLDDYTKALQDFVAKGKLTPAVAAKILNEYRSQKASIGPTETVNQVLKKAEKAAFDEIDDLLKTGRITQDVASLLVDMINKNVSQADFKTAITQLVQQNRLRPDIAKLKLADYQAVRGLRDMSQRLGELQGNNAPLSTYADELKRAVQDGVLTPAQAAQLMQEYQALHASPVTATTGVLTNVPGSEEFAKLQQRLQGSAAVPVGISNDQFAAAQTQAEIEDAQARQQRIEALMNAMSGQAQQLISAWQPPTMLYKAGSESKPGSSASGAAEAASSSKKKSPSSATLNKSVLIKAGAIIFAVLDTTVNSDYPEAPVMATIVSGAYQGAKLLGKLNTQKGPSGQLDRVTLSFTLMNTDEWPASKSIQAYAIDPDTARTVLASQVDYHYLKRFGAIIATSFVRGYADAINNSGATTTTGIFGTSSTRPQFSPGEKLATAIGQIGQTLGTVTQNYVNTPPTVRVDSGVGLGILFMADVT